MSHPAPSHLTLPDPSSPTGSPILLALQDGAVPAAPPAAPPEEGRPEGGGSGLSSFLPFILIGVVFWMLIIGPERKNRRKREAMLAALAKGDRVMTTGGLYGKVAEIRDDVVILDTGDVRLKFARSAIQGVIEGSGD